MTIVVRHTNRFVKSYKRLDDKVKEKTQKALRQFLANPRHPGLHFEKLIASGYRTIRVDDNFRIVLHETERGVFDLVEVASHTAAYRFAR